MILWPSSGCCRPKQSETILNVLKKQDKEIVFLWNQSGQMLNKLKNQEKIQSQRETMKEISWWVSFISRPPSPPPVIQPANESPMYIITNNQGHWFLNANECHIVRHPHPSPERKGKCEHFDNADFNFVLMQLLTFQDFVGQDGPGGDFLHSFVWWCWGLQDVGDCN